MKTLNAWIVVCVWTLTAFAARADDLKPEQLYKKLLPSVMTLTVQQKDGTFATGTGFLAVKDGVAATAWHVVKDAKSATAKFSDGEEFEVTGLIDKDEKRDVAIVRVKEFGRPLLSLATTAPEVGSKAFAVGAPEGLEFSLSDGLISQVRDVSGVTQLQFTCPISPGNSGGPLINAEGQVVGVICWRLKDGQNLNFATPVASVQALAGDSPAQSWGNASEAGGSIPAVTDDELDRLLADSINGLADAATTIRLVDEEIVRRPSGYKARVPPCLDDSINQIAGCAIGVASARSGDPVREAARVVIQNRLFAALKVLSLESQEIDAARAQNGWGGKAGQLFAQSLAPYREFTADYPDEVINLSAPICINALITTGPLGNLAIGRELDFQLHAFTWVHDLLTLAVVPKDSLAYNLGLRTGDKLLLANEQELVSLLDLKMVIKDNFGGKLRLTVARGGKRKEWEASVPHNLPYQ